MMKRFVTCLFIYLLLFSGNLSAQFRKDRKIQLNESGSDYIKFTLLNQVWVRNTNLNPGSTIYGYPKSNYSDIGIRRLRMQMMAQLNDRAFIYAQVGQNNLNYLNDRKFGFFIHDATGEFEVVKNKFSLGAGLTGWTGLSRFSSPSAGSILGVDAPLFEQSTNDVNDQFLRKLSVFAKGKLGSFDYRVTVAHPLAIQKSNGYSAVLTNVANFSAEPPKMQTNGYFKWQFLDKESNQLPYTAGTYLGTKKVFNIGAGFLYQEDAMWQQGLTSTDTLRSPMKHFAVDVYYDAPVGKKKNGQSVSAYLTYTDFDFGGGYLRNLGPMNMANGSSNPSLINGGGNNFPAYGTGGILYGQFGYKFRDSLIGNTTLMPYFSIQHAKFDRLENAMNFYDLGINWLLSSHVSKLTLAYQNRPLFYTQPGNSKGILNGNRGSFLLQYQVFLN